MHLAVFLCFVMLWCNVLSPSLSAEPTVIAKSSILLDVKPWDDETDMVKMEECVRTIQLDGLVWGQCKFFSTLHIKLLC